MNTYGVRINDREQWESKAWVKGLLTGAALGVGITVTVFLFALGAFK